METSVLVDTKKFRAVSDYLLKIFGKIQKYKKN
jgi:hypothetical protein